MLRKNVKICKTFNDYFVNITDELVIFAWGEEFFYYSKLTNRRVYLIITPVFD